MQGWIAIVRTPTESQENCRSHFTVIDLANIDIRPINTIVNL